MPLKDDIIELPGEGGTSRAYEVSFKAVSVDTVRMLQIYFHAKMEDTLVNENSVVYILLNGWNGTSHAYTVSGAAFRCLEDAAAKGDRSCADAIGFAPEGSVVRVLVDGSKVTVLLDGEHLGSFNAPKVKDATFVRLRYWDEEIDIEDEKAETKAANFTNDYPLNTAQPASPPPEDDTGNSDENDNEEDGWSTMAIVGVSILAVALVVGVAALFAKSDGGKKKKSGGATTV